MTNMMASLCKYYPVPKKVRAATEFGDLCSCRPCVNDFSDIPCPNFHQLLSMFRFMVGDLSDSDCDLPCEPPVKDVEFQGTEETHRAYCHGTELIPWYDKLSLNEKKKILLLLLLSSTVGQQWVKFTWHQQNFFSNKYW